VPVPVRDVRITGGFWKTWQETVANRTIPAVYGQFEQSGRFRALSHRWRSGEPGEPHIFFDSDAAKWIEGAAYSLCMYPNAGVEAQIESIVDLIESGMSAEGYFNSHYQTKEPHMRWMRRENHELYCAGHLMEAAVAYCEATGRRRFLDLMRRYGDYIGDVFMGKDWSGEDCGDGARGRSDGCGSGGDGGNGNHWGGGGASDSGDNGGDEVGSGGGNGVSNDGSDEVGNGSAERSGGGKNVSAAFETPGHEEIELALLRMWQHTGEQKWLGMARHFIDRRGKNPSDLCFAWFSPAYAQDQAPVADLATAEGHAVRFGYLFTAVAWLARETGDKSLAEACRRVWRDAVGKKMYVTGGVGSLNHGEAFGPAYFLPNFEAYTETCASIAMAFFAWRLAQIDPCGEYADVFELQLYNGALAGISLDGKGFFYENPLCMRPSDQAYMNSVRASGRPVQRLEMFSCSCCPPNIMRFIMSLGGYMYDVRCGDGEHGGDEEHGGDVEPGGHSGAGAGSGGVGARGKECNSGEHGAGNAGGIGGSANARGDVCCSGAHGAGAGSGNVGAHSGGTARPATSGTSSDRPTTSDTFAAHPAASGTFAARPAASGNSSDRPAASGTFSGQPTTSDTFAAHPAASGTSPGRTAPADTLYVHHYAQSVANISLAGQAVRLEQKTSYPWHGSVELAVYAQRQFTATIALRAPAWCAAPALNYAAEEKNGYLLVTREWKDGDRILLELPMGVAEIEANPNVPQDAGRVALKRGPLVYCVEEADNGERLQDLLIAGGARYETEWAPELLGGVNAIRFGAFRRKPFDGLYRVWSPEYEAVSATAVPYYAWANRSPGEMAVWLLRAPGLLGGDVT
jgi:DUF1680 family protein